VSAICGVVICKRYNLRESLRFVLPLMPQDPDALFCAEAPGASLAWHKPERYGPNGAASLPCTMYP